MLKKRMGTFLLILALTGAVPGVCRAGDPVKKVSGTAKQVDYVGSTLVLQNVTSFDFGNEITFSVTGDTKITRGVEPIELNDIEIDDPLAVTYRKNDDGTFEAVSIDDLSSAYD
ncbi:MAG TPA: hypothetical protein PKL97_00880 [Candidatus Omnitrophota bacterium]|nr:hypothetical protein [Candidatus Omnitrophota bacterium]